MATVASTASYWAAEPEHPRGSIRRSRVLFTPLRRDEHPWYKPWQSQALSVGERVDGGFTFRSRKNEVIKYENDNRHDGEYKFQWLHANARNLVIKEGTRFVATVKLDGQQGMLKLQLVSSARESATGKTVHADTMMQFGDEPVTKTLRAVIDSASLNVEGRVPNLQLRLIWKTLRPQAQLSGSASLIETSQ
jgi:hypothetical protein